MDCPCNSKVREFRAKLGISGVELGAATNLAQPTISMVERGFWGSREVRQTLADFFGVPVVVLFPNVPTEELERTKQL